uniref:ATP synthase CF1 subunit epsilon n=1 Tax=Selaginella lepidophylla TaxID=59777 RepID=A0A3Q9R3D7_SELLP|nr:ATP synthase CF1 subunit epsilon [Selaginella lepidophylla]AZU95876.1 ATP synthase CF1 subunit epsilon [Selaginella lepidophylla]
MTLNLRVMTPNQVVWDSEVQEVILYTISGQIGVLTNHAPLLTALDIGVLKIRIGRRWSILALMGGFAVVDENRVTVPVNEADKAVDLEPRQAKESYLAARAELARAEGRRQTIEANLAFRRAKARLDAVTATSAPGEIG